MDAAPPTPRRSAGSLAARGALGALVPLFALDVLTAFTVGMVPPLLPLLAAEWTLSPVEVGLVNTVYALGRLGTSYPASRGRARYGTRAVVFVGLALSVAGAAGCGLARSFPGFLAGRLIMGIGASAAFLAMFAELLERAPAAARGRLTNLFEAMAILSLAVGGVLGSWLAERVGWRWVFLGAVPVLFLGASTWPALDSDSGRRAPTPGAPRLDGAARHRRLLPVYLGSLTLALTWAGLFATLAPLLGASGYRLGAGAVGLAMGAAYVAELAGLLAVGLVIDRVRREPVFLAGALAVAAGGVVLGLGTRPAVFVVSLVLLGGGFAVWMVPATVLTDRVGTPLPPGHLAVYRVAMDAGMIAGPLVVGAVADLVGARIAAGGAGFVLVAGAVALARSRR
jgi:MFS family permease